MSEQVQEQIQHGPAVADSPAPAEIELVINGQQHTLPYEKAFALGYSLLEKGRPEQAIQVFDLLMPFTDRGPRAFIMRGFCEAAAKHYAECSAVLSQAFEGEALEIAQTLHNVFVFYHLGSRKDAMKELCDLVNAHRELPTLSLLLGDMLADDNLTLARKCWKQAVRRDRPGGAVAAVAQQRLSRHPAEPKPPSPATVAALTTANIDKGESGA